MNNLVQMRMRTARVVRARHAVTMPITIALRFGGSSKLDTIPTGGGAAGPLRSAWILASPCSGVGAIDGADICADFNEPEYQLFRQD